MSCLDQLVLHAKDALVLRVHWVVVIALFGCERAELLGRLEAPDAAPPAPDSGVLEPGVPRLVPGLSVPDARDTDPTFTADLTELYFMSQRTGSKDLYRSLRASATDPWGAPERVEELSTGYQEENPRVSPDGLELWFFTDRDRSLGTIWRSNRESRSDPWGEPTPISEISVGAGSSNVSACPDAERTLAAHSGRVAGSPGYELFLFERPSTDVPFMGPSPIEEVNSASDDFDPFLAGDGLAVAFSSNRSGTFDLYLARRSELGTPFEGATALDLLNTADFSESAPAFSPGLDYVMYASTSLGDEDIFEALLFP